RKRFTSPHSQRRVTPSRYGVGRSSGWPVSTSAQRRGESHPAAIASCREPQNLPFTSLSQGCVPSSRNSTLAGPCPRHSRSTAAASSVASLAYAIPWSGRKPWPFQALLKRGLTTHGYPTACAASRHSSSDVG